MFRIQRRMSDGTFKTVVRYADEASARRRLAFLIELHPDRRYGLIWPESFLHTFDKA